MTRSLSKSTISECRPSRVFVSVPPRWGYPATWITPSSSPVAANTSRRTTSHLGSRESGSFAVVRSALDRTKPKFKHNDVDRKADPESQPEELAGDQVGGRAGSEEDTHDGAGSGDSKKDCDRSQ